MSTFDDGKDCQIEFINREKGKYLLIDDVIKWLKTTSGNLSEEEIQDDENVELIHKFIKELVILKNQK